MTCQATYRAAPAEREQKQVHPQRKLVVPGLSVMEELALPGFRPRLDSEQHLALHHEVRQPERQEYPSVAAPRGVRERA